MKQFSFLVFTLLLVFSEVYIKGAMAKNYTKLLKGFQSKFEAMTREGFDRFDLFGGEATWTKGLYPLFIFPNSSQMSRQIIQFVHTIPVPMTQTLEIGDSSHHSGRTDSTLAMRNLGRNDIIELKKNINVNLGMMSSFGAQLPTELKDIFDRWMNEPTPLAHFEKVYSKLGEMRNIYKPYPEKLKEILDEFEDPQQRTTITTLSQFDHLLKSYSVQREHWARFLMGMVDDITVGNL